MNINRYASYLSLFLLGCTLQACNMPGGSEWVWIIIAILIFFGGKKIPELMRGLGKGMREFNDAKDGVKREFEEGLKEKDKKKIENDKNEQA